VLLNTCRHRGNAVCRAEEGHATSFMCTYHGWTYDLQGKLVGVPGFKDYYNEDLNRDEWGLVSAAKVDSYKGFVFATLDPEATAPQEAQPDWRERPEAKAAVGFGMRFHQNAHPHIFPNMWLTFPGGSIQVGMRMPKGPTSTEIWWFTLIDHDMPAENQASHL